MTNKLRNRVVTGLVLGLSFVSIKGLVAYKAQSPLQDASTSINQALTAASVGSLYKESTSVVDGVLVDAHEMLTDDAQVVTMLPTMRDSGVRGLCKTQPWLHLLKTGYTIRQSFTLGGALLASWDVSAEDCGW